MDEKMFPPALTSSKFIQIWTDGSCYYKTREGGIGIYIEIDAQPHISFYKGLDNTSVGRTELFGILMGMRLIKEKHHLVELYCDSQYAINCMNGWIESWSEYAFVGKKNIDLLKALLEEKRKFKNISFKWVKGHASNEGNKIADKLADCGYKNLLNKLFDKEGDLPKYQLVPYDSITYH